MKRGVVAGLFASFASFCAADGLPVTENAVFVVNGQEHMISRSAQIDSARLNTLAQPPADCPAPCIAPMQAARGVLTLGELDVIAFLSTEVEAGTGLLVDARLPEARGIGFIPASVSIPSLTIAPSNPYRGDILQALGAQEYQGLFNFDQAYKLVIFDSGPSSHLAQTMITDLIEAGYPADKLAYYRGGMQVWSSLGLSVEEAAQ